MAACFSSNDAKVTCLKGTFSLGCVSGSLKGTLGRPEEMVYVHINNTDVTITNNKVALIAVCDNSIVRGSCIFLVFMAYYAESCTFTKLHCELLHSQNALKIPKLKYVRRSINS